MDTPANVAKPAIAVDLKGTLDAVVAETFKRLPWCAFKGVFTAPGLVKRWSGALYRLIAGLLVLFAVRGGVHNSTGGFTFWNCLDFCGSIVIIGYLLAIIVITSPTARGALGVERAGFDELRGGSFLVALGAATSGVLLGRFLSAYAVPLIKLAVVVLLAREVWKLFLWPVIEAIAFSKDPGAFKTVRDGAVVLGFNDYNKGSEHPFVGVYGDDFKPGCVGSTTWHFKQPARPVHDSLFIQFRYLHDYYTTVQLGVYSRAGQFLRAENAPFPSHMVQALSDAIPKSVKVLEANRYAILSRFSELQKPPPLEEPEIEDSKDDVTVSRVDDLAEHWRKLVKGVDSNLSEKKGGAWEKVLLPAATKNRIERRLNRFAKSKHSGASGLLLYGPPGTGKTLLAKAIAEHFGMYFKAVTPADLKGQYIGQSEKNTKDIWDEMRRNSPSVLFVDECEGVFARRGSHDADSFDQGIVRAFISNWDGMQKESRVFVIGATNNRTMVDEAIVSRFSEAVEIPLPDELTRLKILANELALRQCFERVPAALGALTIGMSGRDLGKLADAALMAVEDGVPLEKALKNEASRLRANRSEAVEASATWDTLVLSEEKKQEIKTIVGTLQNAAAFHKRGIAIPKGVLFYGPPGTGKTQIARTIANEAKLSFHLKTTADIKGNFLGQSANNTKSAFAAARAAAPAILCFDEIDLLTPARQARGSDVYTGEIVGQILQEMDGARADDRMVCVIGITNNSDTLDPAILSRFGIRIEVPLPNEEERCQLFDVLLKRKPVEGALEELILGLAKKTAGKSGRDLKMLVEAAERKAVARALAKGKPEDVVLCSADFGEGN